MESINEKSILSGVEEINKNDVYIKSTVMFSIPRISRMSPYSYILSSPCVPYLLKQHLCKHKICKELYIAKQKFRHEQKCRRSPVILVYPIYRIDEE
jgi:hypothetical protein